MRPYFALILLLCICVQGAPIVNASQSHSPHRVRLSRASRGHHSRRSAGHGRALTARYRSTRALHRMHARSRRKLAVLKTEVPASVAMIDPAPAKWFRIPAALRGSHDSLVRQNVRAEADGLLRIENDVALRILRENKSLVAVPVSESLRVDDRLPADRRYCRDWTARFLVDLARVHFDRFHRPLQVNSAVRTVDYQRTLGRKNGNAAAADGDIASPHLTGATIDIAKKGLSMQQIGWMRAYLLPLQTAGKIDVEEEFHQSCFHITVYKSYLPSEPPQLETARNHAANGSTLLAAKVR